MPKNKNDPALIKRVSNVHRDDIHGIYVIDDKRIISGSKDGDVKVFNYKDFWEKERWNPKPLFSGVNRIRKKAHGNQHWITAIDIFNRDASVLFGNRGSTLVCMDVFEKTTYTNVQMNRIATKPLHCKVRNENRITGIKCLQSDGAYTAVIGVPQQFYHYDCNSNKILGHYTFEHADWPYGFCQIAPSQIVAIHGCSLSVFKFEIKDNKSEWELSNTIIQNLNTKTKQKPFISSVLPMDKEATKLALSFFGGATKVLDIETNQAIHESEEHSGRVWQAAPLSTHEYVSCADDATIKIWDLRVDGSVHTYSDHPGRVSSIAVLSDSLFVAGTCADNVSKDTFKGQFYFYDIRRNASAQQPKDIPIDCSKGKYTSLEADLSNLKL